MPFIKVFTNQSKAQLGDKFMPTVCEKLGQVLNKDLKWFNWILETDKQMSKVTICFLLVKLPIFPTFFRELTTKISLSCGWNYEL